MKVDYSDKFRGSLMGVAIGDTLGAPFEGQLKEEICSKFTDFDTYIKSNKKRFKTITDDTQLTIHLARAIINAKGFKMEEVIREFVKWLDDPPIGPGYGCMSSIQKLKYGISWQKAASNSGGNGTLMRIAPVGLFFCKSPKQLREAAIKSSIITHSHPAASTGAIVIARAVAYLVELNPKDDFSLDQFFNVLISAIQSSQEEIVQETIGILHKVRRGINLSVESGLIKFSQIGVKSPYFIEHFLGKAFVHPYALSTLACALFLFLKFKDDFREGIYELATAGGDTDTVAAIGGGLLGAYLGYSNIPEDLIKLVKQKKKILKLSEELVESFERRFHVG